MQFTRGMIIVLGGASIGSTITFQWNPREIREEGSAKWVPIRAAGCAVPFLEYTSGNERMLRFRLEFSRHHTGAGYVDDMLDLLMSLTEPGPGMGGQVMPPLLKLLFGQKKGTYVMLRCDTHRHTKADPDGLRWQFGSADLTLSEYRV